jgi:Putative zinc-finger
MPQKANARLCPEDPNAAAEEYLLGRMTPTDAESFEAHYLGCPACLVILQNESVIARAFKGAAHSLSGKHPR